MPLPSLLAGDLRDRIQIRRPTEQDDGEGGSVTTWATIAEPWAEVLGIDGRESVIGQALQGISYFRIRIRWRGAVTAPRPKDQIKFRGTDLNIRSVTDPTGRREQLLILADTGSVQQ